MNPSTSFEVHRADDERPESSRLGFVGFLLGLAAGGMILWKVAGPPRLPTSLPSWASVVVTLQGTEPPLDALAYVFTTAAWLLWMWIVGSLILRLIVGLAETISHEATWARSLRIASNLVTLPIVRRIVDGAIVAVIVVTLVSRTPRAYAASLESPAAIAAIAPRPAQSSSDSAPPGPVYGSNDATYTVRSGDTLWTIAEHFYGDGEAYRRLVDANAGRRMPDGRVFTRAGVIQPGWVLRIPEPTTPTREANKPSEYVVRDGDTLRGIAARFLGDEMRWPAIFDLNRGTARLPDGRTLTNPDLIWPGLLLRLQPPAPPPPDPSPSPAPSPPSKSAEPAQVAPQPTVQPTISPVLPTVTPEATPTTAPTVVPVPTAIPTAAPTVAPPAHSEGRSVSPIAVAAGAAVLAGGAALLARRRIRRSLREPPIRPSALETAKKDEFADAEFARTFGNRLRGGDAEPVLRVAAQALRFFAERGLPEVVVVQATHQGTAVSLLLSAGLLAGEQLRACAEEFGTRFSGKCLATVTPDHDVLLYLGRANLAAIAVLEDEAAVERLWLLPLGIGAKQETLWVNWRELGHVLVAGLPGGGADVVLTSLICALAARGRPEEVRLWTIASPRFLPSQLADLPQQARGLVDPEDVDAVREVLGDLRAELARRMRRADVAADGSADSAPAEPDLVLVIGELSELPDDEGTLDLIGTYGAKHGVRIVAATTRGDSLGDDRLGYFATRLMLQTLDDDESIRLLGQPDAADLGNAEFFLRLAGRAPTRLRGFRVSADHLAELVRLMSEDYHDRPDWILPKVAPDDEPEESRTTGTPSGDEGENAVSVEADAVSSEVTVEEVVKSATQRVAVIDATRSDIGTSEGPASNGVTENGRTATGQLVQVQCFGDFRVRSGERELNPLGEEKASYRAWEVLAFLAAHRTGPVSKEKLFAAIWPEADEEAAANCLRQALFRLRAVLSRQIPGVSPDLVRNERDGTCRLDPKQVSSDVQEFLALCDKAPRLPPEQGRNAWERALTLYRGDLFNGRGTRAYAWVDERDGSGTTLREQYREEYCLATQHLAQLYCRMEHTELAVPLLKGLLKAEPTLEDVVRDLYRCYRQLDDLGSLIREERHLRQALREGLYDPSDPDDDPKQYQPEEATIDLHNEVRAELEGKGIRSGAGADASGAT